ncbi:MAG: hypothetical protein D6730_06840 [Bacteroidetes bacterium]|nr:MAG: hypothetical protein D6730_06840 [Bacteroidota bacterium]
MKSTNPSKLMLAAMAILAFLGMNSRQAQWLPNANGIHYQRNVGVGTILPQYKVDVWGDLRVNSAKGNLVVRHSSGFGWEVGTLSGGKHLVFNTVNDTNYTQNRIIFRDNGDVGLGTNVPGAKLHIIGPDNNGTTAGLKLQAGTQVMLLDGNEIDGLSGLYLNYNTNKNVLMTQGGGNVGIGTVAPQYKLDVRGNRIQLKENSTNHWIAMRTDGAAVDLGFGNTNLFVTPQNVGEKIFLDPFKRSGVTIGTQTLPAGYRLAVDGRIICEEVRVEMSGSWPDYVFAEDYDLMPLADLEQHIATEKHLPGIPAAATVEAEGIAVGEMQQKMMEKIEELTLYIIQQQKEIEALRAELRK